jgi:hypothetical protein
MILRFPNISTEGRRTDIRSGRGKEKKKSDGMVQYTKAEIR